MARSDRPLSRYSRRFRGKRRHGGNAKKAFLIWCRTIFASELDNSEACGHRGSQSIRLDAGAADHSAPLLGVFDDEFVELGR